MQVGWLWGGRIGGSTVPGRVSWPVRHNSIWKWKSLSGVWLCDPKDYTVHGVLQTRILEWVAFPFSRGSSQPRDRTQVSCIAGGFFTSWATREALNMLTCVTMWDLSTHKVEEFIWHTYKTNSCRFSTFLCKSELEDPQKYFCLDYGFYGSRDHHSFPKDVIKKEQYDVYDSY